MLFLWLLYPLIALLSFFNNAGSAFLYLKRASLKSKRAFPCIEEGASLFYSCFLLCFQLNFLCFIGWLSLFYRCVFLVLQLGILCFVESAFMYLLESLQLLFLSSFHIFIIVSFPPPAHHFAFFFPTSFLLAELFVLPY